MTVVGLQKNTSDTTLINNGDLGKGDKLAGLGSNQFLEILSMLADNGDSEISEIEKVISDHIPTTRLIEGYKTPNFVSQSVPTIAQTVDTYDGVKIPISYTGEAASASSTEEFSPAIVINKKDIIPSKDIDEKDKKTFSLSLDAEILKLQTALENLKTSLEQSTSYFDQTSDEQVDQKTMSLPNLLNTNENYDNTNANYDNGKLTDILTANSGALDKLLNLKILDDPHKNIVTLNSSKVFSGGEDYEGHPNTVKIFMRQETELNDVLDAREIIKVNIKLGSEYTDIQLINNKGTNEIEKIRLFNPADGIVGLEIDKSNIKALSVSILNETLNGSNLNSKEIVNVVPNIVLEFNNLRSARAQLAPSVKIQSTQKYLLNSDIISSPTSMGKISSTDPFQPEVASKSSLELARSEAINSDLKFSEIGSNDFYFNKKQVKNVVENVINNLSLFKTKDLSLLVSRDNFSEIVQRHHNTEQISRVASLLFITELNVPQTSTKSSLLSSTANVLRYMDGRQKLTPKVITPDDYLISQKGDLMSDIPVETIARKEQDLGKASQQTFLKLVDGNIFDPKNDQIKAQQSVLSPSGHNSGQPQVTSSGVNLNFVSNNSLQVLDAQFNSRLGMLLTDRVASGQEKFELQLEPESFGKVRVSVSLDNSALEVKMVAENTGAVSILRNAEGLLQSITDQSGLKLSDYSVEMQNNSENKKNSGDSDGGNTNNSEEKESNVEEIKANDLRSRQENSDQVLNLLA